MMVKKSNDLLTLFGRTSARVAAFITVLLVFVIVYVTLEKQRELEIDHTVEALHALAKSTSRTLEEVWFVDIVNDILHDLDHDEIRTHIKALLNSEVDHDGLITHPFAP